MVWRSFNRSWLMLQILELNISHAKHMQMRYSLTCSQLYAPASHSYQFLTGRITCNPPTLTVVNKACSTKLHFIHFRWDISDPTSPVSSVQSSRQVHPSDPKAAAYRSTLVTIFENTRKQASTHTTGSFFKTSLHSFPTNPGSTTT